MEMSECNPLSSLSFLSQMSQAHRLTAYRGAFNDAAAQLEVRDSNNKGSGSAMNQLAEDWAACGLPYIAPGKHVPSFSPLCMLTMLVLSEHYWDAVASGGVLPSLMVYSMHGPQTQDSKD